MPLGYQHDVRYDTYSTQYPQTTPYSVLVYPEEADGDPAIHTNSCKLSMHTNIQA